MGPALEQNNVLQNKRCDNVQMKELQPMPIALLVDPMMVHLTCLEAAHIQW